MPLSRAARPLFCRLNEHNVEVEAAVSADLEVARHAFGHGLLQSANRVALQLRKGSTEFAQFWEPHGVVGREGGERTFNHPRDGFVRYEQVTFDLASQSDVKLTLLVAPKTQRVGTGLSPR